MRGKDFFRRIGGEVLETFYPSRLTCLNCGRDVFCGEPFCAACVQRVTRNDKRFCPVCGMPTSGEGPCIRCVENVNYFDRAYSVYLYDDGIKPVLRRFKEKGEKSLASALAAELWRYMREYGIEADLLTFVPLTERKRKLRGYNQAEELARALSALSGIPAADLLEKTSDTEEQKTLDYAERQLNLHGKFRLRRPRIPVAEQVLLLDDVMTTTATVNECCRVLSKVCENGVKVLTICTTVKKIATE